MSKKNYRVFGIICVFLSFTFVTIPIAYASPKTAEDLCDLGQKYLNGDGVTQDYEEAFKLYTRAAKAGSARAQNQLGIMYQNGKGTSQSCKEAIKWYNKAVANNYSKAKANLANLYFYGDCGEKDVNKSIKLYTECGNEGVTECMKNAGIINYKLGNSKKAFKWLSMSAKNGDVVSQRLTGMMYLEGEGVSKNTRNGAYWLRQAALQDDQEAIQILLSQGLR